MKEYCQYQSVISREPSKMAQCADYANPLAEAGCELPIVDDDRYPGSFFRIPGLPAPGKTTWSLAK